MPVFDHPYGATLKSDPEYMFPAQCHAMLERFPISWTHLIENKSLKIKKLEHVLIEKVDQLFRNMH
jgi:hypothetical protein